MNDTPSTVRGAAAAGTITIGGDLTVNRLGFGAMRLTGPGIWGEPKDPQGARRVLQRALELGVNFIDTADSYGPDVSERLIARDVAPVSARPRDRDQGRADPPGARQWERKGDPGTSAPGVRREPEAAAPRAHRPLSVPRARSARAAGRFRGRAGEAAAGRQDPAHRRVELQRRRAGARRTHRDDRLGPESLQRLARRSDDVVTYCEQRKIAFIPHSPLAAGEHAGRAAQSALTWLLARSPMMLPIPGTSSVAHLEENVAAAGISVT